MKRLLITVNGKKYEVDVEVLQDDDGPELPAAAPPGAGAATSPARSKPRVVIGDRKTLTSPINGVVLEVRVREGEDVKETAVLFVLEAMKMKTNISSPQAGTVQTVHVRAGENVETGQVLLTFS